MEIQPTEPENPSGPITLRTPVPAIPPPPQPQPSLAYPQPQYWAGPPYRPVPGWVPPPNAWKPKPKPKPFRVRELGAVIGAAVVLDLATWHGDRFASGGFGLGLFFVAVPVILFAVARVWKVSVRLGLIGAMLVAVALRSVIDPTVGTTLAGLGLVGAFVLALRSPRTFVPEAIASALSAVAKLPSRLGAAGGGVMKLVARTRLGKVSVLPIVVPFALVAVFATVFALANPVVAHGFAVCWSAIASIGLPPAGRVVLFGIAAVGATALLRPSIYRTKLAEAAPDVAEATPTSLLVARNALVGLNVLFFAYNALDAAYLWSGKPPAGMHTQQYAHEGAFWLTLALVMLTAVVGFMFKGPLAQDTRAKHARWMAYGWMAQGLVLALGTYRRIAIHIGHSGLSDLRIVGILGTTLVVVGVVLVAQKLRIRRTFTWLVRRQLDALAITCVLYAVTPTHWVSAKVNVARISAGEYTPLLHMFRQSQKEESVASLVPLLHHPDHRVRQGVGALLEQERTRLETELDGEKSWREHDVAGPSALAALDAAKPDIAAALGTVDRSAAKQSLLEISRVANEDRSLEELLAVPDADAMTRNGYNRARGDL